MGEKENNGTHDAVLNVNDDSNHDQHCVATSEEDSGAIGVSASFLQKLIAEVVGTYFLIFAGCAAVAVNNNNEKVVTLPGISIVWGLAVTVLIYSVGHISGAHFSPAVTLAFASTKRFPLNQVPAYIVAQVIGATLASGTLRLLFNGKQEQFVGTVPAGSNLQAFVIEFIITFYLLFIVCGVCTDDRAVGELGGIVVGSTVTLNVLFAGPITGASMNPARTLGPAIVSQEYRGLWIYIVAPILGATAGAWVYNIMRQTDAPVLKITKCPFLKPSKKDDSK